MPNKINKGTLGIKEFQDTRNKESILKASEMEVGKTWSYQRMCYQTV